MPVVLATLFTSPQDIWDRLSIEGVDLREDDHNLASGQIIQTTADTPIGSSTMTVTPLPVALLAGAQLTFEGAGMTVPVTIQLTAAASIGATSLSFLQVVATSGVFTVVASTIDVPSGAQARDSGVNAATGARMLVAARHGTTRVKLYCNARYDDSQLRLAGSVLDWATTCASKYLCTRRAQGCPKSILADYDEAIRELGMVQRGQLNIESIGTRGVDWPTVVNVTVNPAFDVMRARVQPSISEGTPTGYAQFVDWNSAASLNW